MAGYALTLDRNTWLGRLKALLPYALVLVVWRLTYNLTGHGTGGNGFAIDPMGEPGAYLRAMLVRSPILIAGQLGLVQPDAFNALSAVIQSLVVMGAYVALLVICWALMPVLRSSPQVRFWAIGMVLSALPISASVPLTRNLMFVAIGAFGWIAQSAAVLWSEVGICVPRPSLRWARWLCGELLVIHLPLTAAERIVHPKLAAFLVDLFGPAVQAEHLDLKGRDLIVVNAPNPFGLMYLPMMAADNGDAGPKRQQVLSPGWRTMEVQRLDERTLVIRTREGHLFETDTSPPLHMVHLFREIATLARPMDLPFEPNQTCTLSTMQVRVTALDERRLPTEVTFRFNAPLDDPGFYWIEYDWSAFCYRRFQVPPIGQTIQILGPRPTSLARALRFIRDHTFQDLRPGLVQP